MGSFSSSFSGFLFAFLVNMSEVKNENSKATLAPFLRVVYSS